MNASNEIKRLEGIVLVCLLCKEEEVRIECPSKENL